jgi:hypothetical protein
MKARPLFAALLFLISAEARELRAQSPIGVIYGTVTGADGKPAREINLTSWPIGVPLGTRLPETRTDASGHYRFENIPWWGRFIVCADDADAGYSIFSTGLGPPGEEVTLSPQHPEAEFNFRLPPPAGFVDIHLTNRRTGALITGVEVKLMSIDQPDRVIFGAGSSSTRPILIAPDKDLLLHVTAEGFHEWRESAGLGKRIHLASGSHLNLEVQLEPREAQ